MHGEPQVRDLRGDLPEQGAGGPPGEEACAQQQARQGGQGRAEECARRQTLSLF